MAQAGVVSDLAFRISVWKLSIFLLGVYPTSLATAKSGDKVMFARGIIACWGCILAAVIVLLVLPKPMTLPVWIPEVLRLLVILTVLATILAVIVWIYREGMKKTDKK